LPTAEEAFTAAGLGSRNTCSAWHFENLQDISGSGIDVMHFTLITFRGRAPKFAVDPGDSGYEMVGLDDAQYHDFSNLQATARRDFPSINDW
jgi:hypothetical protein